MREVLEGALSEGLGGLSVTTLSPSDKPTSRLVTLASRGSCSPFSLRLYAADPAPLSAVCLNHVGSFEPSDCAICVFDMFNSSAAVGLGDSPKTEEALGSGVGRVHLAELLSEAGIESGFDGEFEDPGRRCHERVPARDGEVLALASGVVGTDDFSV